MGFTMNSMDIIPELDATTHKSLPYRVISPSVETTALEWVSKNRELFDITLLAHGAVLLRGFKKYEVSDFERFIQETSGNLLSYRNRSTPRSMISGRIYTSTEYPADQTIPQHNENSYTHEWPKRLFFCCMTASHTGGQTPISDSRNILKRLPSKIIEKFEQYGVLYLRTFTKGLGLTWQETFQMTDRIQMQKYCNKNNIFFDWLGDGRLRIKQVLQATNLHPTTGEKVWFNQAHLFHSSSLPQEIKEELGKNVPQDEMPRNAFYGNGDLIDDDTLDCIRQAYDAEERVFDWQEGDLLIIDNLLVAHGRKPFAGPRQIIVGMT